MLYYCHKLHFNVVFVSFVIPQFNFNLTILPAGVVYSFLVFSLIKTPNYLVNVQVIVVYIVINLSQLAKSKFGHSIGSTIPV